MSSDNSSTNNHKIKQFGLYKTIDARTEEFLKLSKKRQLKQGCVCAAISTVITVTVVVSVILVYEYRFDRETNRTSWYGPMNKTNEVFEKHNKPKVQFDKTTVKLLPILLKAINNNSQLQKIIEDYSVPNASFEIKNNSEQPHNNFLLSIGPTPTSKLIRGELNILPRSLFKKTDNLYSRMKKEKDYVKFSSYLENILNEKLPDEVTSSVLKHVSSTTPTVPIKKIKYQSEIDENLSRKTVLNILKNPNRKNPTRQRIHNCKCNKKVLTLLENLASTVSKLIPNIKGFLTACNEKINSSKILNEAKKFKQQPLIKAESLNNNFKTPKLMDNSVITLIRKQMESRKLLKNNSSPFYFNSSPKKSINKTITIEMTTKKYEAVTKLAETNQDQEDQVIKAKSARTYLIRGSNFKEMTSFSNTSKRNRLIETTTKSNAQSILQIFKNINNSTILNESSISYESKEHHNINKLVERRADTVFLKNVRKNFKKKDGFYVPQLRINYNTDSISTTKLESSTVNFHKIYNKFIKNQNNRGSKRIEKYEVDNFKKLKYEDLCNGNGNDCNPRKLQVLEKAKKKKYRKATTTKPTLHMIKKKIHTNKESGSILRSAISDNKHFYAYDDYYDININLVD